jgi:DNA-binding NarL/FixJ family response regulator
VSSKILLQAIDHIRQGDIWIPRLLVPKVIGSLVQMKSMGNGPSPETMQLLKLLSKREHDVAKMINEGRDNKTIASKLFISERTVKAHLTSIFKKLNVPNRLHLALLIKGLN